MRRATPTASSSSPTGRSSATGARGTRHECGRRHPCRVGGVVIRVALKGYRARKLRVVLSLLAVALGVALIAGTYVLTDTINHSFDKLFRTANQRVDVAVMPHEAVKTDNSSSSATPTIPESVLRRIEQVPGVAQASGGLFSQV